MSQDVRLLWIVIVLLTTVVLGLGLTTLALHGRVGDLEVAQSRQASSQPAATRGKAASSAKGTRPGGNLRARLEHFAKSSSLSPDEVEHVYQVMSKVHDRTNVMNEDYKAGKLSPEEIREAVHGARVDAEQELEGMLGAERFGELKSFLSSPASKAQIESREEENL